MLGDKIHVLEEKPLAIHRSDRFEIDGRAFPEPPTGRAASRFVVCICQYGTFLRSIQESIACCASGVLADAR